MIRINLVREGRAAVRGAAAPGAPSAGGPGNLNNVMVIGLAILGLLVAGGYWFVKNRQLQRMNDEVAVKRDEAQKLDKIIKEVEEFEERKDALENRIALINQLKRNQKGPVRILDRISQDLPDLVWLDKMTLKGNVITLDGRALNPNAVASFVSNIKADDIFEEPEVSAVTRIASTKGGVAVYRYGMTFKFSYGQDPAAATDAAAAEGGVPGGDASKAAPAAPPAGM